MVLGESKLMRILCSEVGLEAYGGTWDLCVLCFLKEIPDTVTWVTAEYYIPRDLCGFLIGW